MSFTHYLYLSYEDELLKKLRIFHKKLAAPPFNYKIWRNETNLIKNNQHSLVDQTCDAIKLSKIFLCFLTNRYTQSVDHKSELNYARTINKIIIILKIENLVIDQVDGSIGMILANSVCIDCFKYPGEWHDPGLWKDDDPYSGYEIAIQIKHNIQVIKIKISNFTSRGIYYLKNIKN